MVHGDLNMAEFVDAASRRWNVNITVATIKRVKELTGVNLGTVLMDEMKGLREITGDIMKAIDVVFAICKPQADALGVTDEQFGEALVGRNIEDCMNALLEALVDFFPSRQARMLQLIKDKSEAMQDRLAELVEKALDEESQKTLTKIASDLQDS